MNIKYAMSILRLPIYFWSQDNEYEFQYFTSKVSIFKLWEKYVVSKYESLIWVSKNA